jgi:hypothetical protein
LPPIVAAPAADSVFTNFGATTCFFGTVVVVVVEVVVGVAPLATRAIVVLVVDDVSGSTADKELSEFPAKVNSTFEDWLAYVSSPARVIVTMHLPAFVAFRTPLAMLHPAPPGADSVYETEPVPDPPVKFRLIPLPAVPEVGETKEPCVGTAFENVKVNVSDSDM